MSLIAVGYAPGGLQVRLKLMQRWEAGSRGRYRYRLVARDFHFIHSIKRSCSCNAPAKDGAADRVPRCAGNATRGNEKKEFRHYTICDDRAGLL